MKLQQVQAAAAHGMPRRESRSVTIAERDVLQLAQIVIKTKGRITTNMEAHNGQCDA